MKKIKKYNLKSIFKEIIDIFKPFEYFTIDELWQWTVFDKNNKYLNKFLEIHFPSKIPVKGRKGPITRQAI
ncbi:MAG: hypothetical protein LBU74_02150 [Methanobacteriaceae archaeon]|nr:hypothetical protein [Candidatus Methanorudis spinitermitis]